jgi:hypothetical protein
MSYAMWTSPRIIDKGRGRNEIKCRESRMKGSSNGKWSRGRREVLQMSASAKILSVVKAEKLQSPSAEARGGGAKGVKRC